MGSRVLRKHLSKTAAAAAALLLLWAPRGAPGADSFGQEKFKIGDKAAEFTGRDLDGNSVSLSSFKNRKVVLLNFWGLRCGACIEEMPYLNAILDKFADRGLVVLGVNTDGVDEETARVTMKEVGVAPRYPVILDMDFTITDTYTNFLVPLTLVIDKQGVVKYIHTGYEKGDEKHYEKAVSEALGS